jgi:uncharacterized SAM-dependent methyltransferase
VSNEIQQTRYSTQRKAEIAYYLRHNEIPIKYQYYGLGAKRYDRLARNPRYISKSELGLLIEKAHILLAPLQKQTQFNLSVPINIIDIGCGNGEAGASIISHLLKKFPKAHLRYIPLDISGNMLKIASSTILRHFNIAGEPNKVDISPVTIDFEEGNISKRVWRYIKGYSTINIYLFLGNTLGNYEKKDEQIRILSSISRSMKHEDWLLLGVELQIERIPKMLIDMYSDPMVINFLSTALQPFSIIPDREDARGHGSIEAEIINRKDIEVRFNFTRPSPPIPDNDNCFIFNPGDHITLAISKRFDIKELKQIILSRAHLFAYKNFISNAIGSAIFLCRRN